MSDFTVDIRRTGLQGVADNFRDKATTYANSVLALNNSNRIESMLAGATALAEQRSGRTRLTYSDQFEMLPALTAVAAGNDPYFFTIGTGTEIPAKNTTGGINLKTQSTTPADNDNISLQATGNSAFKSIPITATSLIVWTSRVSVTALIEEVVVAGLVETYPTTDILPKTVAGEGAQFMFDPGDESASGLTAPFVGNWILAHKVNGTDTYTDTDVPVVAGQDYELRIEIGADLKASYYIDNLYVGQGPALTSGDTLSSLHGIQINAASPAGQVDMDVRYLTMSRAIE